jgi:hypothetical protein
MFLMPPATKASTVSKAARATTAVPAKKVVPAQREAAETVPAKQKPAKKVTAKKAVRRDEIPIVWRGRRLNARTILMLQSAERHLGGERMVITQGSFNTTVEASKGTHDRGGVFDVSVRVGAPINKKLRALRRAGFAAWHRTPDQFKKEEHVPEHIHAVSLFDNNLAANAKKQKTSFLAVPPGNGLASGGADDGPQVPRPAKPTLVKQTVRRRDILLGKTNDSVGYLQDVLGLTPDRFFGAKETLPLVKKRFGWNGKKPMREKLFRKLFPVSVFELDATVKDETVVAAGAPIGQPAGAAPTPV